MGMRHSIERGAFLVVNVSGPIDTVIIRVGVLRGVSVLLLFANYNSYYDCWQAVQSRCSIAYCRDMAPPIAMATHSAWQMRINYSKSIVMNIYPDVIG